MGNGSAMNDVRFRFECGRACAQGQGKGKNRAAARTLRCRDFPLVRLNDGAANGETQADAGCRGLAFTAGKFLKYRLLAPGGQARTVVRDGKRSNGRRHLGCQGPPCCRQAYTLPRFPADSPTPRSINTRIELHQR